MRSLRTIYELFTKFLCRLVCNRRKKDGALGYEGRELKIIEIGDFRIDRDTFRASIRNRKVRLTLKEFKLLVYLAKHPSRIIRHEKLVSAIWAADAAGQPERLRVLV